MKFYLVTKGEGTKIKKKIRELIDDAKYVSVKHICEVIGERIRPDLGSDYIGWECNELKKKMRIRETKIGWYLYLPEPTELPFGDDIGKVPEPEEKCKNEYGWKDESVGEIIDSSEKKWNSYILTPATGFKDDIELAVHLAVRCCRVISKPSKNKIKEEFGFFHGWFELKVPKSDGTELMYPIGIVEMQDGTVRQVKPDHIIFGWED